MSFVRPELAEKLAQWREPLMWGTLLGLGLWLVFRGVARDSFVSLLIGSGAMITGALLLNGAIVRARLAGFPLGAGVVVVDEGRIVLLGPERGGVMDLAAISCIEVVSGTSPHWRLGASDGSVLEVPMAARGADKLVDALGALPGFDISASLSAATEPHPDSRIVWRSGDRLVPTRAENGG